MGIKAPKFIRAFFVLAAIGFPVVTPAETKEIVFGPDLTVYAVKPQNVVFPGFIEAERQRRPAQSRGLSGFVNDIRNFVRSSVGAPSANRFQTAFGTPDGSGANNSGGAYEPPFPIQVGQDARRRGWAEVTLGFSIKEVLLQIFSTGTTSAEFSVRRGGGPAGTSQSDWFGSWFGNWFDNWFGHNDLRLASGPDFEPYTTPSLQPREIEDPPLLSPRPTHYGDMDAVMALRKKVLALLLNPYVFFSFLLFLIYLFIARFRRSAT